MIVPALALLVVALAFIAAELFLPTHGVLAVFAAAAALGSVILAFKVSAGLGLIFAMVILISIPFVFYWTVKIYPKTPVGRRVILAEPGAISGRAFEDETSRLSQLVGQRGVAVTMLRPAGSVEVGGRRVDAMSEAEVIDAGTPIEVVRVSGLKVFVKPATA